MTEVGYCKPPVHRRFKPGQSGNPKGRGVRKPRRVAELINEVLDGSTSYRERGQMKRGSLRDLSLRMLVDRAANGDIGAAEDILKAYRLAARGNSTRILVVENWLPDQPGQTGAEKTKLVEENRHTDLALTPAYSKG